MTSLNDIPNLIEILGRMLAREYILSHVSFNQQQLFVDLHRGKIKPFLVLLHRILLGWSPLLAKSLSESCTYEKSHDKGLRLLPDMDDASFVSTALRILHDGFPLLYSRDSSEQIIRITPSQVLSEGKFIAIRIKLLIQFIKLARLKNEDLSREYMTSRISTCKNNKLCAELGNFRKDRNKATENSIEKCGLESLHNSHMTTDIRPSSIGNFRNHLIPHPHPEQSHENSCDYAVGESTEDNAAQKQGENRTAMDESNYCEPKIDKSYSKNVDGKCEKALEEKVDKLMYLMEHKLMKRLSEIRASVEAIGRTITINNEDNINCYNNHPQRRKSF